MRWLMPDAWAFQKSTSASSAGRLPGSGVSRKCVSIAAAPGARATKHVADEPGPEIRPADAEVDRITDRAAGSAEPRPAAQLGGQRAHAGLRAADRGNHVGAVDGERSIALLPQSGVEDR